jgi:hypothetical protein
MGISQNSRWCGVFVLLLLRNAQKHRKRNRQTLKNAYPPIQWNPQSAATALVPHFVVAIVYYHILVFKQQTTAHDVHGNGNAKNILQGNKGRTENMKCDVPARCKKNNKKQ